MADRPGPAYGTPNFDMLGRWMQIDPVDDGPFWALNLMKYRAEAAYADGRSGVSGRAADDAYSPLGPLAAVGAVPAFLGDVVQQPLGDPGWDRVGIVRYPSRAAFFAMQQREDFKAQHVHKEAGMDFTIVMSCLPTSTDRVDAEGSLVLVVERGTPPTPSTMPAGTVEVVSFEVEGVIVGDERTFDRARFLRVEDPSALGELLDGASALEEAHVLVLDPAIDRILSTID